MPSTTMRINADGRWAWPVCAGCTLWNGVVGGSHKINGVLYVEYRDLFNTSTTATSAIAMTQGILALTMAPVGGYLADKVPFNKLRIMMAILYTLAAACVAMAGYMPNLPLTILTYGALLGVCIGLVDPIALALPSHYFIKKRNIAYGIAFSGSSIGSLIFPLFFASLVEFVGFRGAMLLFSGIWLQCLLVPAIAWPLDKPTDVPLIQTKEFDRSTNTGSQKPNVRDIGLLAIDIKYDKPICPNKNDPLTESSKLDHESLGTTTQRSELKTIECTCLSEIVQLFREYKSIVATPRFPFLMLSLFFGLAAYANSFFILPPLAKELGLSKLEASTILVTTSVVEIVSKLVVGLMVDRCHIPKRAILLSSYAITGTAGLIVSFMQNPYALYGYGVVLGAFGGSVLGLSIPMMIDRVGDEKKGTAAGIYPLFIGTSSAIGPIILGSIAQAAGSFMPCLRVCACAYLLGIICYLVAFAHKCRQCKTPEHMEVRTC